MIHILDWIAVLIVLIGFIVGAISTTIRHDSECEFLTGDALTEYAAFLDIKRVYFNSLSFRQNADTSWMTCDGVSGWFESDKTIRKRLLSRMRVCDA